MLPGRGNPKRSRPAEPLNIYTKIEQRLQQLDPDTLAFLVFGFHNNDLFGFNSETRRHFEPAYRKYFIEKIDEFLRWAIRKKGFRPITLRRVHDMARANSVPPAASDVKLLASQIVDSVEKQRSLPLYVRSARSGHCLVEAWQLLAGRGAEIEDLLGPVERAPESVREVHVSAEEVAAAARALPADAIPSRVIVGAVEVNAAEFLYLMARVALGDLHAVARPLNMLPPVRVREERFQDVLSLLQMWTYKPAYFGAIGSRLQRATSVEVNLRTGRMQRDGEMRLLRPEDRPPW